MSHTALYPAIQKPSSRLKFLNTEKMNQVYKTIGKLMLPDPYAGLVECTCNEEGEKSG